MNLDPRGLHLPSPWYDQVLVLITIIVLLAAAIKSIYVYKKAKQIGTKKVVQLLWKNAFILASCGLTFVLATWSLDSVSAKNHDEAIKSIQGDAAAYWIWRTTIDCGTIIWLSLSSSVFYLTLVRLESELNRIIKEKKEEGT